mmetsp:Transcript_6090/g.17936  ORF Transcript_6090/g.17936 Transcript_6090/m.17936 type:complete len:202 (-) Transcript_6090:371-976(-)
MLVSFGVKKEALPVAPVRVCFIGHYTSSSYSSLSLTPSFLHVLHVLCERTRSISFSLSGGGGLFVSLRLGSVNVRLCDCLHLRRLLRLLGTLHRLGVLLCVGYDLVRHVYRLRLLSRGFLGVGVSFLHHNRISLLFLHGLRLCHCRISLLLQVRIRIGSCGCFSSRLIRSILARYVSLCLCRLACLEIRLGDSFHLQRHLQ